MKRFLKTLSLLLVCGTLAVPSIDARGRNDRGQSPQRTHSPASRPGNSGQSIKQRPGNSGQLNSARPQQRPGNSGQLNSTRPQQRPGNSGQLNSTRPQQRPGNSGQINGTRPGNMGQGSSRPNNNFRPGSSHGNNHNQKPNGGSNFRPDNKPGNFHPGNNHPGGGPVHGPEHGYRPPRPHHQNFYGPGPVRPYMPPRFAWHRPAPPSYWRPSPGWRPFHSILGITLGTTLNLTLNSLINSGYTITSYGTNSIFVQNVPMLNMMWPDAELFYNNAGGLCGSEFIYSTPYYDMNRYNSTFSLLTGTYGQPISIQNTSSGMEAMWWGTNNQFIRLAYMSDYAQNGSIRYFTTLSFGI